MSAPLPAGASHLLAADDALTALALLDAALVALVADIYPTVAMVVVVVTFTLNAVTLARSLR